MSNQDQYGSYMAQQPQHANRNANENTGSYYHSSLDNPQISADYAGQQQLMYGEYVEQSQYDEGEYSGYSEYGVSEYYAGSGEKLRPLSLPPRRRGRGWIWYLLIPTVIIVMMIGFAFHREPDFHGMPYMKHGHMMEGMGFDKGDAPSQTINLPSGMTPTLVINDTNGSVFVHSGGDSNVITVTVPSNDGEHAQQVPVTFDKQHDVLSIDATDFSGEADIVVTTPTHVDVQVQDGSGDVQLQGIDGQVNLTSQDGSINLTQANLYGSSSINSQSGSISFDGSLDQQGSYDFETVDGFINLTLPPDASFQLETTNDLSNDFVNNSVGSTPRPLLKVNSQNRRVSITKEVA